MRSMCKLLVETLLILAAVASFGQQQIDPSSQIQWPLITGAGTPAVVGVSCSAGNYGQPYQNTAVTPNTVYTCGTDGWAIRGGTGSGTVNATSGYKILSGPSASGPTAQGTNCTTDATGNNLTCPGNLAAGTTNPVTIGGATGSCAGLYAKADGTGCGNPGGGGSSSFVISPASTNFVFKGDSLTYGAVLSAPLSQSFPAQFGGCTLSGSPETCTSTSNAKTYAGASKTVVNLGISGETCATMLSAYATEVRPYCQAATSSVPVYLHFLAGTNDLIGGASASTVFTCISSYWAGAVSDGCTVTATTITQGSLIAGAQETARQTVNESIRAAIGQYTFLDDLAVLLPSNTDTVWFQSADTTHYTAAATAKIADFINGLWSAKNGFQTLEPASPSSSATGFYTTPIIPVGTTTGIYIGIANSSPWFSMVNASAPTDTRLWSAYVDSSGTLFQDVVSDNHTLATHAFSITRATTTPSVATLNEAVQINGPTSIAAGSTLGNYYFGVVPSAVTVSGFWMAQNTGLYAYNIYAGGPTNEKDWVWANTGGTYTGELVSDNFLTPHVWVTVTATSGAIASVYFPSQINATGVLLVGAAPSLAGYTGFGNGTAAASNCNVASPTPAGCLTITINAVTHYVPYY